MAVEEVVLWAPGDRPRGTNPEPDPSSPGDADGLQHVAVEYVKLAHARDRLALNAAVRLARLERFDLAVKSLVKSVADEAVRGVPDRNLRMTVRKDVYACTMALARIMSRDHLRIIRRGRRTFRWGLGLASVGLAGILVTFVANGWIGTGWLG